MILGTANEVKERLLTLVTGIVQAHFNPEKDRPYGAGVGGKIEEKLENPVLQNILDNLGAKTSAELHSHGGEKASFEHTDDNELLLLVLFSLTLERRLWVEESICLTTS